MSNIFIRAHKSPFRPATAEQTIRQHLIGNNVGNLIFSQSVCRLLSTRGTTIRTGGLGGTSPWGDDRRPDRLVLPLANAFRPGFGDRLERMATVIEQAAVPVTVLGVGAQATLSGRRKHRDATDRAVQRFVRATLQHSTGPIGVRGEFTREYLAGLGFGAADVTVIGCPSMFGRGADLRIDRRVDAIGPQSAIALNISPYVPEMGPLSRRHAEQYPNLTYIAQNQQSLEFLLTGHYPAPPDSVVFGSGVPVTDDHPLIQQDRTRFFLDPVTWIDHLRDYQFSFGTRIHGNIAALLAGTPAVVLAHDSRTAELAEYHDIPFRLITDAPGQIDAAELYAEADWGPLNRGHAARWSTFADFLRQHDLSTVYDDGQDGGARFDARLAAVDFPAAVRRSGPGSIEPSVRPSRAAGTAPIGLRRTARRILGGPARRLRARARRLVSVEPRDQLPS
ncbi:polysaccharide pyruvyl transferase family protein [Microlunatus soli]|uniref:Polysaccharide pyruvyl transferase n=1 Tax=Microlunatus soli TaxID=630515 RepID=A0A1H2AB24_9ACTN|nr:polysaccharide pyruvyl transferase family protein [Microlunatus soli]SDT43113.1 Polysaccharide pyruvyl transferase [Microlunatus soli]